MARVRVMQGRAMPEADTITLLARVPAHGAVSRPVVNCFNGGDTDETYTIAVSFGGGDFVESDCLFTDRVLPAHVSVGVPIPYALRSKDIIRARTSSGGDVAFSVSELVLPTQD